MKWPGGRWVAHRSQQGYRRGARNIVLGPVQVNWAKGLNVYVTWPVPLCIYAYRRPQGHPIPTGQREG